MKLLISLFAIVASMASILEEPSIISRVNCLEMKVFDDSPYEDLWRVRVWGEALYWKTSVDGLPFAHSYDTTAVAFPGVGTINLDHNRELHNVNLGYGPGFQFGLDMMIPFDNWDIALIWTRLYQSAGADTVRMPGTDLNTVWDQLGLFVATTADATLTSHFQTIDLDLGKMILWSKPFSFRPYFGLRSASLHFGEDIEYVGVLSNIGFPADIDCNADITLKNNFSAFGLLTGLDTFWKFGWGFELFAAGEVTLLYGKFTLTQNETVISASLTPNVVPLFTTETVFAVKSNFVFDGGLQWSYAYWKNRAKIILSVSYEFSYWPNQILLERTIVQEPVTSASPVTVIPAIGDIALQGFNFSLALDF